MMKRVGHDETAGVEPPRPEPTPAARRALTEAAERRAARETKAAVRDETPTEVNGRGGVEPVRYGDWEVKGLAVDF